MCDRGNLPVADSGFTMRAERCRGLCSGEPVSDDRFIIPRALCIVHELSCRNDSRRRCVCCQVQYLAKELAALKRIRAVEDRNARQLVTKTKPAGRFD